MAVVNWLSGVEVEMFMCESIILVITFNFSDIKNDSYYNLYTTPMTTHQHFSLETLISQVCPNPQIIPENYVTQFGSATNDDTFHLQALPVEFDSLVPLDRVQTVRWSLSTTSTFFKSILLILFESMRLLDGPSLTDFATSIWTEIPKPDKSRIRYDIDQLDRHTQMQKWITNYFQINIIVFVWGPDGIQSVDEFDSVFEGNVKNPFLPTLMLFKPSVDTYQPIIVDSADMVWSPEPTNLLRRIYVAIRSFLKNQVPDEVGRLLFAPLQPPSETALTGLDRKSLAELQQLAIERGISITKTSATTGKQIRKMKAELIAELV